MPTKNFVRSFLDRYGPPIRHCLVDPAMPPGGKITTKVLTRYIAVMALSMPGPVLLPVPLLLHGMPPDYWISTGLVMLFVFNFTGLFRQRFSAWDAAEFSAGAVMFAGSLYCGWFMPVVMVLGALAALRPHTAGPQPRGWWDLHDALVEAERKRLKGRREK